MCVHIHACMDLRHGACLQVLHLSYRRVLRKSPLRAVEKKAFASYTGPNVRMCLCKRFFVQGVACICKVSHATFSKSCTF